jgi:hypothetical protein
MEDYGFFYATQSGSGCLMGAGTAGAMGRGAGLQSAAVHDGSDGVQPERCGALPDGLKTIGAVS